MDLDLKGKRALVTGSSAGIGVGIAEALVAEGAQVVVHGRNAERATAVAERLGAAVAIGTLSTDESAAAVAETALAAYGGIDILVNNAGGGVEVDDPSWFKINTAQMIESYQANVLAAHRLVHAFVPGMRELHWGRIINIGTGAATFPTSAQTDYGPAKAAMLNMAMGLSRALKGSGITVNTVSPGMIRTEGLARFLIAFADKRGWGDDVKRAEDYIVAGAGQSVLRPGEVEDIAYAVTMLASPRSSFLNGLNIHADGGSTPTLY